MFTISEGSIQEEERQRQLGKVLCKLKELEDEFKGIIPSGNGSQAAGSLGAASTNISNRTVNSSMSGSHGGNSGFFNQANSTSSSGYYNNKNQSDFLVFKNITDK